MKNYISATLLALSCAFATSAQIQVGSHEIAAMNNAGKLTDSYLEELKNTTTVFVLQDSDFNNLSDWDAAIKSVWTITPFKIVRNSERRQFVGKKYSYFTFGGFVREVQGKTITTKHVHITYDLWKTDYNKSGEASKHPDYYSRIMIYPENAIMMQAMRAKDSKELTSKMNAVLYKSGTIYNWSPYMLKGYLKVINDKLLAGETRGPFNEEDNDDALKALQKDTLYVPDYVSLKFSALTGAEHTDEEADEELQKSYPYPVKVVSKEEINKIISTSSRPIHYLVFIKSSSDKYVNVYESGSGKLLYARYSPLSYNFKNKDLSKLAKNIR
jgi:hypothetical protein